MSLLESFGILPGDPKYNQLVNNPQYLAATPAFARSVHDILFNYGLQPTAQQQADYGVGPVEQNPYSVSALLQRGLVTNNHHTMNAASNANLEESGAAVGGLNANNEQYKQQSAQAAAAANSSIASALAGYGQTVGGIFNSLEQQPVVPTAVQPVNIPALGSPGLATGVGTGRPVPQQAYTRTGPEAGWAATPVASKLLKTKLPPIGGMGHIT